MAAAGLMALIAAALAVDVARSDQQRVDDLYHDLAVATLFVGEDTLAPQLALNEFAGSWDTILAAINGREEHFSTAFTKFQELFPDVRAMHVATSPEYSVGAFGDPDLVEPFARSQAGAFCANGKGYSVVATGIGSRGWVALALDPERSLSRARAGARQPISLSLIELGSRDVLRDFKGLGCRPIPDDTFRSAAAGEYGASIAVGPAGPVATAYSPVVGTSLGVVVEDDGSHREMVTTWRRATIVAGSVAVFMLGYLGLIAWRRSGLRIPAPPRWSRR